MANLADKSVLVKLKRGMFDPSIMDRDITKGVEQSTGIKNAGRYKKRLLAESPLFKRVTEAWSAMYTYHQQHTLPWTDNGPRLLPSALYLEYTDNMRKLRAEADRRLQILENNWAVEVHNDAMRLGTMFNPDDYPRNISTRFYHDVQFLPVPSSGDFRVQIDAVDKASLERAIQEAESNVTHYLVGELLEPLKRMADKLNTPANQKGAVFRNTLIENVVETAERLKKLNIGEDIDLDRIIEQVAKVGSTYVGKEDMLRADTGARQQAAADAQAAVNSITDIFGGI